MKKYYLGIDQGTTGTRALLFNKKWQLVGSGYEEIPLIYPQRGWVEHDVLDIWNSVLSAVDKALKDAEASADTIISIGINHEGESVVMWDSLTGMPVYHSIVWQDKRNATKLRELAVQYNDMIHHKTGLMMDTYFSAPKYSWILEHVEKARMLVKEKRLMAGTIDSWLIWKMTHGKVHVTDASTASRTLLYNIHTKNWDKDIAALFGIDIDILPEICNSAEVYAYTDPLDFLGIAAPIAAILVDQQAAMIGQACILPGTIKTTYGTGCFMLLNTGNEYVESKYGLLPTVAWKIHDKTIYALDGGVYTTGAAIKWMADKLGIMDSPSASEGLAKSVADNGGVYFVPAFNGLAAPYWDSYASGMMIGINGNTTKAHIVRAALEATAFQVHDVLQAMIGESQIPIRSMRCNGAATKNSFLMQFQSDILGISLEIPAISETTAFGAAFMGAVGRGLYDVKDIENFWEIMQIYEPAIDDETRNSLLYDWHRAVQRAKYWIER